MKVRDLMTPDVEVVDPDDTLKAAALIMADLGLEALPVGQDNRLVGTISGHDIALHVAAGGGSVEEMNVREAMSADVLYCFAGESARAVSVKMREWWVRRLPVVGPDKRLVGTVSLGDLTPLGVAQARAQRIRRRQRVKSRAAMEKAA